MFSRKQKVIDLYVNKCTAAYEAIEVLYERLAEYDDAHRPIAAYTDDPAIQHTIAVALLTTGFRRDNNDGAA